MIPGQSQRLRLEGPEQLRQIELYHNTDGKVYCLLEAPSAEAVRQHHEALGVDCGEVHEVKGLL